MQRTAELETLDRLLDPIRDCLTVEVASRILNLRADESVQTRLDQLADRNAEGIITAEERSEYESLVSAGNLIAVFQAKACAILAKDDK